MAPVDVTKECSSFNVENIPQTIEKRTPKAKTGMPPVVRTAMLLRRQKRDRKGKFAITVEVESEVNWWQDTKEKVRKAIGARYRDDPVNFDPAVAYVVQDGSRWTGRRAGFRVWTGEGWGTWT
ncbi:hypothetical protein GE21DRAFT_1334699 [Neurospora crassa]|nr:hypothetical protein GE21DRAFT_1334699 [Neurospora crassa]